MRTRVVGVIVGLAALIACSPAAEVERRSAVEHGRDLFTERSASASLVNRFTCATCHASTAEDVRGRILPGHVLAGVARRPTFWGASYDDLLVAINACRYFFMTAPTPWTADDPEAQAMYAYLTSLPPTAPDALPLTVPAIATDLPPGDPARGKSVYEASCRSCHGAVHTGAGRLRDVYPVLPDEPVRSFTGLYQFSKQDIRVSFIEKVRHGGFLGVYGSMPFYAVETMSDADLGALAAFLELY